MTNTAKTRRKKCKKKKKLWSGNRQMRVLRKKRIDTEHAFTGMETTSNVLISGAA